MTSCWNPGGGTEIEASGEPHSTASSAVMSLLSGLTTGGGEATEEEAAAALSVMGSSD